MYEGKLVFAQLMEHLPTHTFRRIVKRYDGDYKVQTFSCLDQFFCMAFAETPSSFQPFAEIETAIFIRN